MPDPIAENDQRCKDAQLVAKIAAAFYNELIDEAPDIKPDDASWLTSRYLAERVPEDSVDDE